MSNHQGGMERLTVKIAIVDDDKDYREIAALVLEMEDYDVEMMSSGQECLEYLEEETPDLLLLDRKMPGMNGLDVLEKIRERGYSVNVALLTAVEQDLEPEEVGAIDYVEKTDVHSPDIFIDKLEQLLESLDVDF